MWLADERAVESISIGAGILGCGGGSNPYIGQLRVRQLIKERGPVQVLGADELPDDARVMCIGGIGAPTVGIEKIRDYQSFNAYNALTAFLGSKPDALISNEIGGGNSIEPMITASLTGLPVVDGDGMGRAFPELQMKTYFIYGVPCYPLCVADEKGNAAIFSHAVTPLWLERMARAVTVQMGCTACYALAPMTTEQTRATAVLGTLTLARDLGEAVRGARSRGEDPIPAILEACPGKVLFQGKVMDVNRRTAGGFSRGSVSIDGLGAFQGEQMVLEYQNENLIARRDGQVVCTTPDLITVVDTDRGEPITTELQRYGFRVTVLGFPSPEHWTRPEGLAVVGPRAFGYDLDYDPIRL